MYKTRVVFASRCGFKAVKRRLRKSYLDCDGRKLVYRQTFDYVTGLKTKAKQFVHVGKPAKVFKFEPMEVEFGNEVMDVECKETEEEFEAMEVEFEGMKDVHEDMEMEWQNSEIYVEFKADDMKAELDNIITSFT